MFAVICLASLWLLQIPILRGSIIVLVLAVYSTFGRRVASASGFGELGLGAGLMLGIGVSVLLGQVLLILGLPPYQSQWTVVIAVAIITMALSRKIAHSPSATTPISNTEPLTALAIALFAFSIRQQWMIPFAVVVLGLERLEGSGRSRPLIRLATSGLALMMVPISASLRPDRWWYFYQGNDSQFFESMGWSGSHWSVFEHPGFVGGTVANYHWLSYVFIGDLNHVAGLPPWDLFMKTGVIITCAATAGVFLAFRSNLSTTPSTSSWALIIVAVAAISGPVYNSLAFSLPMGMMVLMLVDRFAEAQRVMRFLLLILSAVALTFTKTSTMVVVLVVLGVIHLFSKEVKRPESWYPLLTLGATSVLLYVSLFRGASQLSALAPGVPDKWEGLRVVWSLITAPRTVLQSFIWLICLVQLSHVRRHNFLRSVAPHLLLIGCATIAISFAKTDALTGFVLPVLNFVTFFALRKWHRLQSNSEHDSQAGRQTLTAILLMVTGYATGFGQRRFVTQVDKFPPIEDLLGTTIWDGIRGSALLIAVTVILLTMWLASWRKRTAMATASYVLLAVGLVAGLARPAYLEARTLGPDPLQNWRGGNSAPFSDTDLRVVGQWIRKNTPSDAVLASNNFCCPGLEWWRAIVNNLDIYEQDPDARIAVPRFEPSFGGDNYLIPVETRRRFYMQGMGHQPLPLGGTISQDQINRMTLSLEFANEPSQRGVDQLKLAGVDGFVVNLALTQHRDWSDYAIEKFKSGNFAYLELR